VINSFAPRTRQERRRTKKHESTIFRTVAIIKHS
jgi:hypothetical protein